MEMMFNKIIIFFYVLYCYNLIEALGSDRIFQGVNVDVSEFPWAVSVRLDNAHKCTGTIVSDKHILTAAHCIFEYGSELSLSPKRVTVRTGSTNQFAGGQLETVEKIVVHDSYGNFRHDLAVLKLSKSLQFNDKTKKIEFAKANNNLKDGSRVVVAGWGLESSNFVPHKLKAINMTLISQAQCETEAGYGYDSVLCLQHAVGSGICDGDDGAGVIADGVLVGIISFAFGECATAFPDIATKLSFYNQWLNSALN